MELERFSAQFGWLVLHFVSRFASSYWVDLTEELKNGSALTAVCARRMLTVSVAGFPWSRAAGLGLVAVGATVIVPAVGLGVLGAVGFSSAGPVAGFDELLHVSNCGRCLSLCLQVPLQQLFSLLSMEGSLVEYSLLCSRLL